jgi:hypothetical protein
MVRLVALKLRNSYALSTVKNLKIYHSGDKYLDLYGKDLDVSLLDILMMYVLNLHTSYRPFDGQVFLDWKKEILYLNNTKTTISEAPRTEYTIKDLLDKFDTALRR